MNSQERRKVKERCRWTTKKGTQCKNLAVGKTGLCYRHNLTVRFKTPVIVAVVTIVVSAFIAFFVPDLRRIVIPEKTPVEKIRIEGNNAIKIKDRSQAIIHSHKLRDLGIQALQNGDYAAYHQAIWQMFRLHEFCVTANWRNDPTTSLVRAEVSDELVSLITVKRLPFQRQLGISMKLGDVALAGTKASIYDYNQGRFFSDSLFAETLEIMRRVIDTLWVKKDYEFARLIAGTMTNVIFAEAHRKLDQAYRICPTPADTPRGLITGERIADVGQPRELDSYYKACCTMSKLPYPLFKAFIDAAKYGKLRICLVNAREEKEDAISISDEVAKLRYYHPVGCVGGVMQSADEQSLLDSLVSSCNKRGQEATECVKQLVWRERYPTRWWEK